jgi:hypothetical protein
MQKSEGTISYPGVTGRRNLKCADSHTTRNHASDQLKRQVEAIISKTSYSVQH